MKFVIERPIDGISLNGNETAHDEDGNILLFDTEEDAKEFLYSLADQADIDADLDSGSLQINPFVE